MADDKIADLPPAAELLDTHLIPVVDPSEADADANQTVTGALVRRGIWDELEVGSLSGSTLDITTFDPAKYNRYRLELWGVLPSSNDQMMLQTSSNGGGAWDNGANNYRTLRNFYDTSYARWESVLDSVGSITRSNIAASTNYPAFGTIDIFRPSDAAYSRIHSSLVGYDTSNSILFNFISWNWRESAADIDGLRVYFWASSTFAAGGYSWRARRNP